MFSRLSSPLALIKLENPACSPIFRKLFNPFASGKLLKSDPPTIFYRLSKP